MMKHITMLAVAGMSLLAMASPAQAAMITSSTFTLLTSDTQINLTTQGTLGWVKFGSDGIGTAPQKAASPSVFSAVSGANDSLNYSANGAEKMSWSDGNSPATGTDNQFVYFKPGPSGYMNFDVVSPSTNLLELKVYVGLYQSGMSDLYTQIGSGAGLATNSNQTFGSPSVQSVSYGVYTVFFQADTIGQLLSVYYGLPSPAADSAQVLLSGATLSSVPEPAMIGLLGLGVGTCFARRRRR